MAHIANVRKMYVNHLRTNKPGFQAPWTKQELLAGLHSFYEEYGRFPMSHEIDAYKYLPSARSIQRTYGGLVALRSELLPKEIANFTKGEHRSGVAKHTYAQGRSYEKAFYDYLVGQFKQIAVHEHKLIRPGNVSCDFFVYTDENTGVVVDIFYAESILSLINVVNIKLKRYSLVTPETFLVVVGNGTITQAMLDAKVGNRRIPLPAHINLMSEAYFKDTAIPRLRFASKYSADTP